MEKKFNVQVPIWSDFKNIQKELHSRYLPLYDLKMNSQMEDVDVKYSLAVVAKDQKVEHDIEMQKIRE